MKNTPFLQELVEARLYKGANTLKGKTAKEIAAIVYLMLLTLQVLRREDVSYAKKYVDETLQFGELKIMRSSMSDMGNLIAVVCNQEDFDDHIATDFGINIPFLQLKRYLNDLRYQRTGTHTIDHEFFIKLESFLKIDHSLLKTMRRYIINWDKISENEKRNVVDLIKREFNSRSNYNDIYLHLKSAHLSFQS